MFKRFITLLLVVVLVVGSVAACSNNNNNEDAKDAVKVGMVTDSGTITDKSFNQGTWEGIEKAEQDLNIAKKYLQPSGETADDYLREIGNLVDADHEVIITPGFKFEAAIFAAQDLYPDTKFIIIDGEPHSADYSEFRQEDNVVSVFFAEQEAGFLAGVAGALESKTGKLGFIGGMKIPAVEKFGWGFAAGVAYANETYGTNAEVLDYIYQGTFSDVAAGTQIAASMYDKGIDVVFAAAGGVGVGAINEAKTRRTAGEDVWLIGVDVDQYNDGMMEDGTSAILTSAMKRIDVAAYDYIKAYLDGNFPGGEKIYLSAKNNGVSLPAENPNLAADTVSKTDEVFAALGDGSLVAPDSLETLVEYLTSVNYVTPDGVEY